MLVDEPTSAACFPGTSMIEQISEDQNQSRVTAKLGPPTMAFTAYQRIEGRDDRAHRATVKASWRETQGRSNASCVTRFSLQGQDDGARVAMQSDLQLAGQVARHGRGAGLISEISAQLI
jgi:carbon monoxide dehydrogenase subunit G